MKVEVKKVRKDGPKEVAIQTEFIRLEAFLKLADAVSSGGEAKLLIQEGEAMVNGETCTMRGKKLRPGDTVSFRGKTYQVTGLES